MKGKPEEEEGRKWAEIGDDVFGLILQRLCLTDHLRTQVVCSSWRSIISRTIASKCCPPLPHELPLVFLQTKTNDSNKYSSFFKLSTKSISPCSGISSQSADCYGTIQGWLIMVDNQDLTASSRSIFFFNPLTQARVLIPSRLECEGKVRKIVASAKPSDPHCVVVCLLGYHNMLAISGISDDSWTLIEGSIEEKIFFDELEILNGKLYALNGLMFRSIIVCDLQNKPIKPKLSAANNIPSRTIMVNFWHIDFFRFLAVDASAGALFLIFMFYNPTLYPSNLWDINNDNIFFPKFLKRRVFKLSSSEAEWIEVENLENRTFFIGKRKSLVVSNVGTKDNFIYFTCQVPNVGKLEQYWKGNIRVGRLCESDKKTDPFKCKTILIPQRLLSSIWFVPSFW